MTILTKEIVDIIASEHGRTSCADDNLSNHYSGWHGYYIPNSNGLVIKDIRYPRCVRCYLLDNVGNEIESLEFAITTSLIYKDI